MPDSISWNFNASASTGGTSKASGKAPADAVMIVRKTLADKFNKDLGLQLETAGKVSFFALTSGVYSDKVSATAGGKTVKLTGPLVLHGDAVALFSADLGKLKIDNQTGGDVEISILIGFDLAVP